MRVVLFYVGCVCRWLYIICVCMCVCGVVTMRRYIYVCERNKLLRAYSPRIPENNQKRRLSKPGFQTARVSRLVHVLVL